MSERLDELVEATRRRLDERKRSRSLADYRREPVAGRARAANALRQLAQLPWFARNLAIKLALAAGLRPLARRLGSEEWPY